MLRRKAVAGSGSRHGTPIPNCPAAVESSAGFSKRASSVKAVLQACAKSTLNRCFSLGTGGILTKFCPPARLGCQQGKREVPPIRPFAKRAPGGKVVKAWPGG